MKICEDFAPNFGHKRSASCITTTRGLKLLFRQGFFLPKNNITIVLDPAYFSPFPRLKIKLKDRHFDTIDVIEAESQVVQNTFTEHDFQEAFKKC
jgi:hypothetical protein